MNINDTPLETSEDEARPYTPGAELVGQVADAALDVEVILDLAKQYFSFEQSKFQGGGTTVKGGIGSLIEFAHAVRSFAAAPQEPTPADTNVLRSALANALEALETSHVNIRTPESLKRHADSITAVAAALQSQPQQVAPADKDAP